MRLYIWIILERLAKKYTGTKEGLLVESNKKKNYEKNYVCKCQIYQNLRPSTSVQQGTYSLFGPPNRNGIEFLLILEQCYRTPVVLSNTI